MKIVSPSTMSEMDRTAIENYKIPGVILMENAGREVALAVKNMLAEEKVQILTKRIVLFCGKGNNGGDGFVAARHLANMGFDIKVLIVADPGQITGDALTNLEIIKNMGLCIEVIDDEQKLDKARNLAEDALVLVDALFGTGLRGEVKGLALQVIKLINVLQIPVLAVDIPSGICGETGKVLGDAVRSQHTVTMALPKIGLSLYPGLEYAGDLTVADIGMPIDILQTANTDIELLDTEHISRCFKIYPFDAHKGTFGRVFIIAGSCGMTGAAALSGIASVKSGAGLVTIGIPESLNDIVEVKVTEAMTMPLAETATRCISSRALDKALEFSNKCSAVVIGPGLSVEKETKQFVQKFVKTCESPLIIDADGLNTLAECPEVLNKAQGPIIITPHPGELGRLLSTSSLKIQEDRLLAVKTAAKRFNCICVLKGARTLIATPEGKLWINPTGNPGMATGGSGDVLSGMIGAFLARGMKPSEAATAGVYLHGLAGDIAVEQRGQMCLTAQDIINFLPESVKEIIEDIT
ncbi:MAG: NAD(P)H-hydrate dehydratase [Tepidanaerobacteraceae bacterium]|nr:NAD(P)H-hydrate dehydratase [Tepidanaerobacteraceae bacterium]